MFAPAPGCSISRLSSFFLFAGAPGLHTVTLFQRPTFAANDTSLEFSLLKIHLWNFQKDRFLAYRCANMSQSPGQDDAPPPPPQNSEHLNIKVTDSNSEIFFKIKRTTNLKKLMEAFCERSGTSPTSVRFLFDGQRVQPGDSPDSLDMADGDTLEVHREQIGG